MDSDEHAILDTVMSVVQRYGMKRTTMGELARGAGVSRQTLYDRFGDKDGIMAAAIDRMAQRYSEELQTAFSETAGLADRLDAYFRIIVWPTYEVMQQMPDAADLEKGMGPASIAASSRVSEEKRKILVAMLGEHLPPDGPSATDVAAFFEETSSRAKMSDMTPDELVRFLAVLKASVLALAQSGAGH